MVALSFLAPAQNGTWSNVQPPASPPFRATEGLAFEPVSGLVVAYGGTPTSSGYSPYSDTWAFDGCSWTELFPAVNPGTRFNAYLAQSPTAGRVVLFGGAVIVIPTPTGYVPVIDGSTWEFDPQTVVWTNVTPAGPSPGARQIANLVYDSYRARTVLFGGTNGYGSAFYNDTWEWDGASWTDVTPAGPSPSPRAWHSMAYDVARQRTVLFGGYNGGQLNDTWEWDGTQWVQVPTPVSPSPRSSGAIAYDPWTQRVVLFAGSPSWPIGLNDTWEYDGTTWAPIAIPGGVVPSPQFLHRTVGDPVRGGILVYGAFGNGWSSLNDTWRYRRAALTLTSPNPPAGGTASFLLSLPSDPGLPYLAGVSLAGTCPGLPLPDGRVVSLNHDDFTDASVSGSYPAVFQGFSGTLDAGGDAALSFTIPPIAGLSGLVIWTAAVTFNGGAFASVTNTAQVVVQ